MPQWVKLSETNLSDDIFIMIGISKHEQADQLFFYFLKIWIIIHNQLSLFYR